MLNKMTREIGKVAKEAQRELRDFGTRDKNRSGEMKVFKVKLGPNTIF